ncbi:hypothetical protein J2128_000294 [Methanomicrobium sp. W14]|uniref:hypothetical protein n=1 Tax=Methanomicrobium sp. W14 TaxID=2817839 RepID=UPI001AE5C71A|nr:hypothetical protein [Methanomicrobium sp. W14]MBP2132373.1 hypothetical protein [Methanomicrobium sp. W14]
MERFVKGDVLVVPFPFSDLSKTKKRPVLVIASLVLYKAGRISPKKIKKQRTSL